MVTLDLTDAILDPLWCYDLDITRRQQVITAGVTSVATKKYSPQGVVTIGAVKSMQQVSDSQNTRNEVTIHAYDFKLYDPVNCKGTMFQPDILTYNGDPYIVTLVHNWSQYGQGFTMATAELYNFESAGLPT